MRSSFTARVTKLVNYWLSSDESSSASPPYVMVELTCSPPYVMVELTSEMSIENQNSVQFGKTSEGKMGSTEKTDEFALFDADGYRLLSGEEKQVLREKSAALDDSIRERLK